MAPNPELVFYDKDESGDLVVIAITPPAPEKSMFAPLSPDMVFQVSNGSPLDPITMVLREAVILRQTPIDVVAEIDSMTNCPAYRRPKRKDWQSPYDPRFRPR